MHRCSKYAELTCQIDRQRDSLAAKDREIARLKAENTQLKAAQCGGARDPAKARPFGSSTPSSKIPVKENSTEEARSWIGGLKKGHVGHGRADVEDPDEEIDLPKPTCPVSHAELVHFQVRMRTVVHTVPARRITRRYTIYRAWCPDCRRYHESEVPSVLPYFAFSNDLMSQVLVDHFGNGIPLGTLARRAGVGKSALRNISHRIAGMLEGGLVRLLEEFRSAPVKHADETTWPCDRRNGCAWGFFTPTALLYRLRGTRASVVAGEVFGEGPHLGVLGVDRYAAYGKTWRGAIQYCLEHYRRNVRDLLEAEPENIEYRKLIPKFLDLLKEAMTLRNRHRGEMYVEESRRVRDEILDWIAKPVKDGRLKGYFDYMSEKRQRFFQWVGHPEVEAENNLAERRLRPLVVARLVFLMNLRAIRRRKPPFCSGIRLDPRAVAPSEPANPLPDYFLGRSNPPLQLIDMVDDCSRMQVGCRPCRRETVASYLDLFCRAFSRYGLPPEIYVDRAGFFRNDNGSLPQLGRRLKFVDVSFVFANTPEAKGKVERLHQVWQDRLPAYAAREGITGSTPLEDVNEHLDCLVDYCNGFELHRELHDMPLNVWEDKIMSGQCKLRQPPRDGWWDLIWSEWKRVRRLCSPTTRRCAGAGDCPWEVSRRGAQAAAGPSKRPGCISLGHRERMEVIPVLLATTFPVLKSTRPFSKIILTTTP